MKDALRTQLESYRDAAWALNHRRAMECRDLEDWLDFGLALLDAIRRIDRRHQERLRTKVIALHKEAVEEVSRLYEIWYSSCDSLLRSISQFEQDGFQVENAERFREACRGTYIPGLEPEKLEAAARQFEAGRGRPLSEVMDGIRRRTLG